MSDVNKFLRSEEKYHSSKEVLDRDFVKQIKANKNIDMKSELMLVDNVLKDYIKRNDGDVLDFLPLDEI